MTETQTPKTVNPRRVMVEARLAFCHLFKPAPKMKGEDELVFQTALLFPPASPHLKTLANAMRVTMIEKFGKLVELKRDTGTPIRPCSGEWAGYEKGWFVVNAKNERQPPVVNAGLLPVTNPADVWAGQWANVVLDCYGWSYGGNGLSFSLQAVQIIRDGAETDPDGPRLDGRGKRVTPSDYFPVLEMPAGDGPVNLDNFDPLAGFK